MLLRAAPLLFVIISCRVAAYAATPIAAAMLILLPHAERHTCHATQKCHAADAAYAIDFSMMPPHDADDAAAAADFHLMIAATE